jgi:DNA-binding protein H-NS
MSSLKDLLAEKAALEIKIAEVRNQEIKHALDQIKSLIEAYQLTCADIFPDDRPRGIANKTEKVPAKYRDPDTGKTWSGRGIAPKWLQGKNKEDYRIQVP